MSYVGLTKNQKEDLLQGWGGPVRLPEGSSTGFTQHYDLVNKKNEKLQVACKPLSALISGSMTRMTSELATASKNISLSKTDKLTAHSFFCKRLRSSPRPLRIQLLVWHWHRRPNQELRNRRFPSSNRPMESQNSHNVDLLCNKHCPTMIASEGGPGARFRQKKPKPWRCQTKHSHSKRQEP